MKEFLQKTVPYEPWQRVRNAILLLLAVTLATWPGGIASSGLAGTAIPEEIPSPGVARVIENLTELTGTPPFQTTRIYDRHGHLLYEIHDRGRRTIVPLEEIPTALIQATIATEDRNFYLHEGVDVFAIVRAAWQDLQAWDVVSGGSTIPQQLARLLLLDEEKRYEKSLLRKIHEARLAMQLNQRYSKDEILEMYLNSVYYGRHAYGVAAAARVYFDKDLSELTLAECALLAGLPQAPNQLDPFTHPEAARRRQRIVLNLMREQGYITEAQMRAALAEELHFKSPDRETVPVPHFVDYVRELLLERFGPEGMRQGLQVYTSIDLRYQELVEAIARAQVAQIGEKHNISNAAVVVIHPPTGQILAMMGSLDYYNEEIDGQVNVALRPRQPGSAIKPILYAAAFNNGWSPASVIWDTPKRYPMGQGGWYSPRNITGRYYGALRLRVALANSLNVSAVKLLEAVGVKRMLETGRKLGITTWRGPDSQYGLSLAVGGYEVTLLDLTHAFATLANNGAYVPLRPILEIRDAAGRVLYRPQPLEDLPRYVISPAAAYQVTSVLSDRRSRQLMFGRNSPLDTSRPTAVKTGTTDEWRDNLTVGYTPYLAVGVWLGNSDGRPMRNATAFRTAGPIWHDIMEAIWANPKLYDSLGYGGKSLPRDFQPPPNIYKAPVCDLLPGVFNGNCPVAYEEVFALSPRTGGGVLSSMVFGKWEKKLGYCLPTLQADLPQAVQREVIFVPLPDDPQEAAIARNWARRYGLRLHRAGECDLTPVKRPLARPPETPAPRFLIQIPKELLHLTEGEQGKIRNPAMKTLGFSQGDHATLINGLHSLNVRTGPGIHNPVRGYLLAEQEVIIREGPQMVGPSPWFRVENPQTGLSGWVNGQYLRKVSPAASTKSKGAAQALKRLL
ncbi:MAG TPA: PBP1A family penicillin-binding protein [Caldilineae bacterium]|nr:PBP1A family penicillin-binding protein [Caldilineae bacterium]